MSYSPKNLIVDNRISAGANVDIVPEFSATLGAAFGTYLDNNGVVVLARDYRTDSRMLKRSFAAGLMSAGVNVLDIHASSTPVLRFTIRRFGASGGVMFTAGHLHEGRTTIKFYNTHGVEFGTNFLYEIFSLIENNKIIRVQTEKLGEISTSEDINTIYHKSIKQFIENKLISNADLRVVMDCANGPVGKTAPPLFSNLDIDVVAINTFIPYKISEILPNINSIRKVSRIISSADADFGVAFDVDASRALFFDEMGSVIDSDLLSTLFFMDLLDKNLKSPTVITSRSTTKMLDTLAEEHNVKLIRVDNIPGEISNAIRLNMANLGVSDGGKIRFPIYAPFTDVILVSLKLAEIIAKSGEKLSNLIANCPQTIKQQEDLVVPPEVFYNFRACLNKIADKVEKIIDTLFGVKIFFGDDIGFINVIPQLYFDRLRLIAELNKNVDAQKLFDMIKGALKIKK